MKRKNGEQTVSLYYGEPPSKEDYIQATNRLSVAFPRMTKEFFVLLTEFIYKEKFTKERLMDAVDYVIANFQYKELNISDIVQYDKRVKMYSYNEVTNMVTTYRAKFEDFERRQVGDTMYWVLKTDLQK